MAKQQDDNYGSMNSTENSGSYANPSKIEDEEKQPLVEPTGETQDVTVRLFDPANNNANEDTNPLNQWKSYIWKGIFIFVSVMVFVIIGITYNTSAAQERRLEEGILDVKHVEQYRKTKIDLEIINWTAHIAALSANVSREVEHMKTHIDQESTGRKAELVALYSRVVDYMKTHFTEESADRKADIVALSRNVSHVVENMKTHIHEESTGRKTDILALFSRVVDYMKTHFTEESADRKADIVALSSNVSRVVEYIKTNFDQESTDIKADIAGVKANVSAAENTIRSNEKSIRVMKEGIPAAFPKHGAIFIGIGIGMRSHGTPAWHGSPSTILPLESCISRCCHERKKNSTINGLIWRRISLQCYCEINYYTHNDKYADKNWLHYKLVL